jgi:hypothetical protein
MPTIPLTRQLAAVRDEIALRHRVYPRFIANGKMTVEVAARRIAEMDAVRMTLDGLVEDEKRRVAPELF